MASREKSLFKIQKAFESMRQGIGAACSWRQYRISDHTFYDAINADPELKKQYKEAVAQGEIYLLTGVIQDKSVAGKIFVLSRVHGRKYGKHKEEEMKLDISDETRKVMTDDSSTGEQKIAALNKDFYANKIQLPLFEKLVGIVKLSHPEMSKTEINGDIRIIDAIVPTR